MVSSSDMFLEFQFLALAQALEVYHSLRFGNESVFRKKRQLDIVKIKQIVKELLPNMENWVNEMLSASVNPSLQERIMEIFEYYEDICHVYLKSNTVKELTDKIKIIDIISRIGLKSFVRKNW